MHITWKLALSTWWSATWRTFLFSAGFFAAATVLVAAYAGLIGVSLSPEAMQNPAVFGELVGMVILLVVGGGAAIVWLTLLAMRKGLAVNGLLKDPVTGRVAWTAATRVYWSWTWRSMVYALALGIVATPLLLLASGNPPALIEIRLLNLVAGLGLGLLSMKQGLQANVSG